MCQFTRRDSVKEHRPGTVCPYTGQRAGGRGGCVLMVVLLAAGLAVGSGIVPLP